MRNGTIIVIKGKPANYKAGTFTSVDTEALGIAVQNLGKDAMKLYCYLIGNKSGYKWSMNATAYARWLGVLNPGEDFANENKKRTVTLSIDRGTKELVSKSYLKKISDTEYEFYEKGTECSCVAEMNEQSVHVMMQDMNNVFINGDSQGTICSYDDAEDEQSVQYVNPDGSFNF